jgi:LuxR family maltose regulon positive regulatory protein
MAMSGNMVLPAGRLAPPLSALGRWDQAGGPAQDPGPATATAPAERPAGPLTEREINILQSIANGRSTQDIAAAFEISEHTVRSHVKRIFAKLGAHSKAEAVMRGVHLGLISTEPQSEP